MAAAVSATTAGGASPSGNSLVGSMATNPQDIIHALETTSAYQLVTGEPMAVSGPPS
jgi:uncharacterized protein YcsI (UPF0317 family)